jgi:hypothetical protein
MISKNYSEINKLINRQLFPAANVSESPFPLSLMGIDKLLN